ncbi:MAG: DUF2480 family protein [Bacteroidota bacterium]
MAEIVNRVAKSKLQTLDLEDLYQEGKRVSLDISQWLDQGFILKEQEFREQLKNHPWKDYQDCFVALHCATDAIVPSWAYLLVSTHLNPFAKKIVKGNFEDLELVLYTEEINRLDVSEYQDLPVIIKGCSNKPVPESAYLLVLQKLQKVAKSIMYGEACSSVPLFKKTKKSN